ncbi:MAG TPA: nuclear transport factor 2 family protein, partial [Acidimicrobiia bacterium]
MAEVLAAVAAPGRSAPAFAARLAAAEDRAAIRDLIMRYGYLEDARRWDDMLDLYTDDIERVLAGSLVETIRGKAALRERLVSPVMEAKSGAAAASRARVEQLRLRHLMTGEVIRVAGDGTEATAAVQYVLVATREDEHGFRKGSHEGSYRFDFRKEHGRWK